nr:hypothetical protein Itr_chr15CG08000 [Ipomoea trifida]
MVGDGGRPIGLDRPNLRHEVTTLGDRLRGRLLIGLQQRRRFAGMGGRRGWEATTWIRDGGEGLDDVFLFCFIRD